MRLLQNLVPSLGAIAGVLMATPALTHTNSVGFRISPSAVTTCVNGGGSTCFDVEVFFGSWHSGTLTPQGELALFEQLSGGGETQVIGPSVGANTPFSLSHSLTGSIPNGLSGSSDNYSTVGTGNYNNLIGVFTPGSDYFFSGGAGGTLTATPTASTSGVYSHQSAVGIGIGPGTYRIAYDVVNPPTSFTWTPEPEVLTATFTVTGSGSVVVNTGGPPAVSLGTPNTSTSGPVTITATFSEAVTGVGLSDFAPTGGTLSNLVQVSPSVYTFVMTPTAAAVSSGAMSVAMPAGGAIDIDSNGNLVSNTLNVTIGASAGLTDEEKRQIVSIVQGQEINSLRTDLRFSRKMLRNARDRFSCRNREDEEQSVEFELRCDELVGRSIPFDIDGEFSYAGGSGNLLGEFRKEKALTSNFDRRLVFGEFEVTFEEDGGSTVAFDGRVAWEKMVDADTMMGYFIGGQLSHSNISSTFTGDRNRLAASGGIYGMHRRDQLLFDGHLSLGVARNDVDINNGTTNVDGDYNSHFFLGGASVSGERDYDNYTLIPELSFDFGHSNIGDMTLDAVSATFSNVETLDAGDVSFGILRFTPEFLFPADVGSFYSYGEHRIAPSLVCEFVDSGTSDTNCGVSLELELSAWRRDNLGELSARLRTERIGDYSRHSAALTIQHRF